ncbi:MAG: iron-sulfur cluster repair di-iron protein [Chitinophagaceae bacterium]|nr:MAG: iron-sulfur cluster repair di-iron protein [Chitinophagaceae bacterium]
MSKKLTGQNDETLGELAAKDLRKAQVFKKYGLDFCCGGKKTVKEACAEKGLDVTKVEQDLQQADQLPAGRPVPYGDWSLDFLADYIVNTHHSYVAKTLPDLTAYADKVMRVHGGSHPELVRINALVQAIDAELTAHMAKEEIVLFPYVKELVKAKKHTSPVQAAHFGTVQNPINMMEMEHEMVGKNLEEIRTLTNNYQLPQDACASYSFLFKLLQQFEEDLHLHIHLENNILFPKALKIERQLN